MLGPQNLRLGGPPFALTGAHLGVHGSPDTLLDNLRGFQRQQRLIKKLIESGKKNMKSIFYAEGLQSLCPSPNFGSGTEQNDLPRRLARIGVSRIGNPRSTTVNLQRHS